MSLSDYSFLQPEGEVKLTDFEQDVDLDACVQLTQSSRKTFLLAYQHRGGRKTITCVIARAQTEAIPKMHDQMSVGDCFVK